MTKILLLLDMNGTVCYRAEEPVGGGVKEDLYIRRKYYYKRRGIEAFIKALRNSGSFDVYVYTSMMRHNVDAGLNAILRGDRDSVGVLDRTMTKPDPDGAEEWDTIRDMRKVWAKLPAYGPKNTILLDNEARKFKENPENGIVVPEFGALEVLSRASNTLADLTTYLMDLAAAAPADVRPYLAAHPFVLGRPTPTTPAPRAALKAVPPPAAADVLVASLAGLSLGRAAEAGAGTGAAPPADRGEAGRREEPGSGAGGDGVAAAAAAGRAPADVQVADGLSLRLVCVDDNGKFVMTSIKSSQGKRLFVRGQVAPGLRIDGRMDYQRLVHEAEVAGVELLVEEQYE